MIPPSSARTGIRSWFGFFLAGTLAACSGRSVTSEEHAQPTGQAILDEEAEEETTDAAEDGPPKLRHWDVGEIVSIKVTRNAKASDPKKTVAYVGFPVTIEVKLEPTPGDHAARLTVGLLSYSFHENSGVVDRAHYEDGDSFKRHLGRRGGCTLGDMDVTYSHDRELPIAKDKDGKVFPLTFTQEFVIPENCLASVGTAGGRLFHRHPKLAEPVDKNDFRLWIGQDIKANDFAGVTGHLHHLMSMARIFLKHRTHIFDRTIEKKTGRSYPTIHVERHAPSGDVSMKELSLASGPLLESVLLHDNCQSESGTALFRPSGSLTVYGAPKERPADLKNEKPTEINAIEHLLGRKIDDDSDTGIKLTYSICPSRASDDPSAEGTAAQTLATSHDDCAPGTSYVPLVIQKSGPIAAHALNKADFQRAIDQTANDELQFTDHSLIQSATATVPVNFSDELFMPPDSAACQNITGQNSGADNWSRHRVFNVRVCAAVPFAQADAVNTPECAFSRVKLYPTTFDTPAPATPGERPTNTVLSRELSHGRKLIGGHHFNVNSFYHHSSQIDVNFGGRARTEFGINLGGEWLQKARARRAGKRHHNLVKYTMGGQAARAINDSNVTAKMVFLGVGVFDTGLIDKSGDGASTDLAAGHLALDLSGTDQGVFNDFAVSVPIPLLSLPLFGVDVSIDLYLIGRAGMAGASHVDVASSYVFDEIGTFGQAATAQVRRFEPAQINHRSVSGKVKHVFIPFADLVARIMGGAGIGFAGIDIVKAAVSTESKLIGYRLLWSHQNAWELGHAEGNANDLLMRAMELESLRGEINVGQGRLELTVVSNTGLACVWAVREGNGLTCGLGTLWHKRLMEWPGKTFHGPLRPRYFVQTSLAPAEGI